MLCLLYPIQNKHIEKQEVNYGYIITQKQSFVKYLIKNIFCIYIYIYNLHSKPPTMLCKPFCILTNILIFLKQKQYTAHSMSL